jgi:hypothetical protein
MGQYVVMLYEGSDKPIGEKRGTFNSIDIAVALLAGHNLVPTGDSRDLRAVAWEDNGAADPQKIASFQPQFVGADSE